MIDRRAFAASAAFVLATSARAMAQTAQGTKRIAVLSPADAAVAAFRGITLPQLAKLGFAEGRNLVVTTHVAPPPQLPELARAVLAAAPDVVVAISHPAIGAARAASASVPIVMAFLGTDPVASGFAASLARPGGNVTGVAMLAVELDGKRASLLREALPGAKRIGVLAGQPPRDDLAVAEIRRVAEAAGVAVQTAHVADPAAYAPAMAELRKAGAEGLVVISAPEFFRDAALIAKLAAEAGLPTACEWASMARDGCLIGYGPNFVTLMQRPATHIAAILSGASPATLPIEQPAVFEFAVNLKTAKALGLTLPQLLLARADEVIE